MQTIEESRGAVLALGFIIGRILHRQKHEVTSSSAAAADAENAAVDRMDVDTSIIAVSSDSALNTAISSAVHQLGQCPSCLVYP